MLKPASGLSLKTCVRQPGLAEREPYRNPTNGTSSLGNEVSISGSEKGDPETVSGIDHTDL